MLNARERALACLLEEHEQEFISQDFIIESIEEYKELTSKESKSHDKCSAIWGDINRINNDLDYVKIIIIDNFKYKLASEEETKDYIEKKTKQALIRLARVSKLRQKARLDGTCNLLNDNEFRETFVKMCKENN